MIICLGLVQKTDELVMRQAGMGGGRVSVVFAGVKSVPGHNYGREVVSDAGVVLNVVEPSRHIHVLLLVLDGQVHLGERGEVRLIIERNPSATICESW